MDKDHAIEIESSQRQHHEAMLQIDRMCIVRQSAEYNLFALLRPSVKIDGNQWCVLYGENIQDGVAGFGDSPHEAVIDWNKQWAKSTNSRRGLDQIEEINIRGLEAIEKIEGEEAEMERQREWEIEHNQNRFS